MRPEYIAEIEQLTTKFNALSVENPDLHRQTPRNISTSLENFIYTESFKESYKQLELRACLAARISHIAEIYQE